MTKKKGALTREQAVELYQDLQRNMEKLMTRERMSKADIMRAAGLDAKHKNPGLGTGPRGIAGIEAGGFGPALQSERGGIHGSYVAIACVLFFAVAKVVVGIVEHTGVLSATSAQAAYVGSQQMAAVDAKTPYQAPFSREEIAVLTSLDARRVELEERSKRLDQREMDLERRDREFAGNQTQLREMTELLRVDREKYDKKRAAQLDQLSNVYGSMDPKEAATLIEQLDVTIALSLLERMPEKRIGQILALMNRERALTITKMLSGKAA